MLPAALTVEELARELYPKAFKEDRTSSGVLGEWFHIIADCFNLENDQKRAEKRVAQGESPEALRLHSRGKQIEAAHLVLQKLFEEACGDYFVNAPRNWPAYVMSQDEDATSKDWHFFLSLQSGLRYRSGLWADTRTSQAFDERIDRFSRPQRRWLHVYHGIHWHVAVPTGSPRLHVTAPPRATFNPSCEGTSEDVVEWVKRERVLYRKVAADEVQPILDRFNTVKISPAY